MDDDWDEEDWPDDDGVNDVVPCPNCGEDIYEDAQQCPSCGNYFVAPTSAWSGKSPIWIILGLAGIIAVIVALSGF